MSIHHHPSAVGQSPLDAVQSGRLRNEGRKEEKKRILNGNLSFFFSLFSDKYLFMNLSFQLSRVVLPLFTVHVFLFHHVETFLNTSKRKEDNTKKNIK